MPFPRSTGILLHPISLPSRGGIGDFGPTAYQFVDFIDYQNVRQHKLPLLREAARNFLESAPGNAQARFEQFCADNDWWLEDFVLFDALRDRHGGAPWNQRQSEMASREPDAFDAVR